MSDTSKTAKIIKRWYYSTADWQLGDVMVSDITFLWFLLFLMCHSLHVAVNKCINWCFVHLSLVVFAIADIPWKFQKDPSVTFGAILLTHRQTDRQTNKLWQKHNFLGGGNNVYLNFWSLASSIVSIAWHIGAIPQTMNVCQLWWPVPWERAVHCLMSLCHAIS